MNESPEAAKNAPAASRPEETGIPSVPPDAREQQDTPAPQHPNASPPEAEGGRQADKEPDATPPLPLENDEEEEMAFWDKWIFCSTDFAFELCSSDDSRVHF